ncbi:MAG: polysaccharide deacetylase family protein [Pseudomonadota bacterium]
MAGDLVTGQYYSFVYGRQVQPDEIPSFCFHGVKARYFEDVLGYMKENNYINITAEEYYRIRQGKMEKPGNAIMVSFDDGTGSIWSVAYPLLEKYGFRATVFLIPGRISASTKSLPNLKDVWASEATLEEIDARDESSRPFLTWEEVRRVHETGVIDFQSHGMEHRQVFIGPDIVDFVRPENIRKYTFFQFSMFDELDLKNPDKTVLEPGSPVYQSAPRLSDNPRYHDDDRLKKACIDFVRNEGGAVFFEGKDWRTRLEAVVSQYRSSHLPEERIESLEEQRQAMLLEMHESKEQIEKNLPGKVVRHFCYPWGVSGRISQRLLNETGYVTAYTGRIRRNIRLTLKQNPNELYRIGPDFFYLLPGKGRDTLFGVLKRKVTKRARRGTHHLSY